MDAKLIEKLRQKYTKNPPEGMTPSLVKNMTDSDLQIRNLLASIWMTEGSFLSK